MRTKSPELAARIGANIKAVRNAANLQQYAVADLAWHKPTYAERVSNIEHGKHTPSLFTLARISDALSVDIDWLVSGNPDNIVYTNKPCGASDIDELAVIAGAVAFRQYKAARKDLSLTWILIAVYWIILTAKNISDFIGW